MAVSHDGGGEVWVVGLDLVGRRRDSTWHGLVSWIGLMVWPL